MDYYDYRSTCEFDNGSAWPVVGTLCQRELVRFFRQKNRVFGALGQPIIFWLLFGAGLGGAKVGRRSATLISFPARW